MARRLRARPELGLDVLGVVDDVPASEVDEGAGPLLGGLGDLDVLLDRVAVRAIIVAYGAHVAPDLLPPLRAVLRRGTPVFVVPRFFELGSGNDGVVREYAAGVPLVPIGRLARLRTGWRAKRLLDVTFAGLGLVLLAPVIGILAALVKLSSPGPAFFRQRRIGLDGRPIDVLKFRSLVVNDRSDEQWSVAGDEGVTRIGKVLRRTSLDELPQLWNVLRGDMSLVGPRPERPHFVAQFCQAVPGYDLRHRVPAGLTGLAQVEGERGYGSSIPDRAALDNRYIEEWTLLMDVAILANTVKVVFKGDKPPAAQATALDGRRRPEPVPAAGEPAAAYATHTGPAGVDAGFASGVSP
jgi:exopolysaccharide biosynthesis polyprenyl glycosylphosphotransferase